MTYKINILLECSVLFTLRYHPLSCKDYHVNNGDVVPWLQCFNTATCLLYKMSDKKKQKKKKKKKQGSYIGPGRMHETWSVRAAERLRFFQVTQPVRSLCFPLSQREVGLFGENLFYPAAQRPVCSPVVSSTLWVRGARTDRSSFGP